VSAVTRVCESRLRLDCFANLIKVRRAYHQARTRFYYVAKQCDSAQYTSPIARSDARRQPLSTPPVSARRDQLPMGWLDRRVNFPLVRNLKSP
jgi:hypothetical protein